MPFPDLDPIIFQIGPFALRWYALAYVFGLIGGWYYMLSLAPNTSIYEQYSSHAVGSDLSLTYFDNQKQYQGIKWRHIGVEKYEK